MNKPDIFSQSGFSREIFLRDYWHKKPLVLRRAIRQSDLAFLPDKTDLMRLTENEDVQSRVVMTEKTPNGQTEYAVEYGPFAPEDWSETPNIPWTLLVSDVEKWLPSAGRLLTSFPFIRHWLFDDLMFSYATHGASVGAHTDHYDVFLVQIAGTRQWQFSQQPQPDAPMQSHTELKLLKTFTADETVTLEPGDLLYLPAEVAHHGIALDDECITCSVGLRAPAESELLTGYFEDLATQLPGHDRFLPHDSPETTPHPAEITTTDIQQLRDTLEKHLQLNDAQLAHWFGRFITRYRNLFFELDDTEPAADTHTTESRPLIPDPFSRMAWRQLDKTNDAELFVNGQAYPCSPTLACALADNRLLEPGLLDNLDSRDKALVQQLLENGEIRPK